MQLSHVLVAFALTASSASAQSAACTQAARLEALRAVQASVGASFPSVVTNLDSASAPGRALEGYAPSHGHVVLQGLGLALVNIRAPEGAPELLFYRASGQPAGWLDCVGADPPYTLVGWGYLAPPSTPPPAVHCLQPAEWFIHEAGWHMKDGSMVVTSGAVKEPERPAALADRIWYWHPSAWDIHLWLDPSGVPRVTELDAQAPAGGISLPGAFRHQ